MKLAQLQHKSTKKTFVAIVSDDRALPVHEIARDITDVQSLIEAGPEVLADLRGKSQSVDSTKWLGLSDFDFAPAISNPPITLAVGLNYDEHASELKLDNDAGPVLFTLFPNSLGAHGGEVEIRQDISVEIDYEGELGVIIGKPAKDVTPGEALEYVFGYTVINDITARDIQFREPQWSRCKSFDGFTPVGPWIVTADEIPDPQVLAITTDVDSLRVQDSTTGFMIRSIAELISAISQGATLQPGTLIATGSPGGAGRSRKPPLYLEPGTRVTVTIERIGALTSLCV